MTQMTSELRHDSAAKKKTKVKVTATAQGSAPGVRFAMAADYVDGGGKQDGDKLKFDADAGAFELTFDLHDDSGLGLAFYPSASEAMWIAVGTDKPTAAGFGNGSIAPVSVADKKLVVTNANGFAETMNFILRFTGMPSPGGGHEPYVLDPLIINGGGRV